MTRNLWHSCVRVRIGDHFKDKDPLVRRVFDELQRVVRACGRTTVYAQKTRIVFMVRVRFAGAIVRRRWLDAGLWLKRRVQHPRLIRVEDFGRLGYGLTFRFTSPEQLDRSFRALVKEAYAIGCQA
ncbi:MAG TPA: DUF5655 domain-containing protein [Gemmatimonadales bacterium]|nr:DUF5655 domain-containing protein [Gemmatimonadales bacterium]